MASPDPPGSPPPVPSSADVEALARAGAVAAGLRIDDAWWPAVVRHLAALLDRAATLDGDEPGGELPGDPAPVFCP